MNHLSQTFQILKGFVIYDEPAVAPRERGPLTPTRFHIEVRVGLPDEERFAMMGEAPIPKKYP